MYVSADRSISIHTIHTLARSLVEMILLALC